MASFFGLTYLGTPGGFKSTLVKELNVNNFTNEEFIEGFKAVDGGTGQISSEQVRAVFTRVYGGMGPESEIREFLAMFDLVAGDGMITFENFCYAIDKLRDTRDKAPDNVSAEYKSFMKYKTDRIKHVRLENDPVQKYRKPVTASQEYGWYSKTKVAQSGERFPNLHCEETVYAEEMIKNGQVY